VIVAAAGATVTLPQMAGHEVIGFMLVLARVGGLFVLAPVFSSRMLPVQVKLMLAAAISLAMLPIATHGVVIPTNAGDIVLLELKELCVGLAYAFPMAVLVGAVAAGASLLDTMVGFSFGAVLDPIDNQQSAVLAQFYAIFTAMIVALSGGDRIMLLGLADSYRALPLTRFPDPGAVASNGLAAFSQVFVIGLEIVAPVVVALMITDAALGLISRAVPQMNVFVVGLPAKVLISFAMITASLPFVAGELQMQLTQSVTQAVRMLGG
jgi:flagellar biosynthetic protein FliR